MENKTVDQADVSVADEPAPRMDTDHQLGAPVRPFDETFSVLTLLDATFFGGKAGK